MRSNRQTRKNINSSHGFSDFIFLLPVKLICLMNRAFFYPPLTSARAPAKVLQILNIPTFLSFPEFSNISQFFVSLELPWQDIEISRDSSQEAFKLNIQFLRFLRIGYVPKKLWYNEFRKLNMFGNSFQTFLERAINGIIVEGALTVGDFFYPNHTQIAITKFFRIVCKLDTSVYTAVFTQFPGLKVVCMVFCKVL